MELPFSSAADRNKDPILAVLRETLPAEGSVLEIASGTGQHVCHFAAALPAIRWQPTEPDPASRDALIARLRASGLRNVAAPQALDVMQTEWPVADRHDAILYINMVHISPWRATLALLEGATRHLAEAGKLILYGPYLEDGAATPSNLEFDASLKRRNAEWGLRALETVTAEAAARGLHRRQRVSMPANNLTLVFERGVSAASVR
jgi:SAM-dependent methyltransferase